MKNFLLTIYSICISALVFSQNDIGGIINSYAAVTEINECAFTITLSNASAFEIGDSILIIQMQGADINMMNTASFGNITSLGSAGNFEKNVITAKIGNIISIGLELANTYDVSGSVQVVSIPNYAGNANVTSSLTAADWNGATGGVLIFSVTGTLTLSSNIDLRQRGFRGGANVIAPSYTCNFISSVNNYVYPLNTQFAAGKGEGIARFAPNLEAGRGKQANGGGGGNDHNAGGAGGGNSSAGGNGGTNSEPGTFNCSGLFPGIGGLALPYTTNKLFMGGGGGSGQGNNAAYSAPDGGGIVIIKANNILSVSGVILANGVNANIVSNDGGIGGSAGGSVLLEVQAWAASLTVNVSGGNGGNTSNIGNRCYGPGGGGGAGVLIYNLPTYTNTLIANSGNSGIVTNSTNACNLSTLGATAGGGAGLNIANRRIPLSPVPAGPIDTAFVVSLAEDTINLCIGQNFTFVLGASPGHAIQWQIDSTGAWENLIPNANHNLVNQNDGFIIINVQSFMDYYSYRMRVIGPCDTAFSDRIYIHVTSLPVIDVQPNSTNSCLGLNAFFTADVSDADTYQWQILSPISEDLTDNAIYSGTQTDSLYLTNIPASLNGAIFRLRATGPCGDRFSSPVFLNFDVSPITISNQTPGPNLVLCEGADSLIYFTSSSLVDNIQWQINTGSGFANLSNSVNYQGVNNDTLLLINLSLAQNTHSFQALLSNACGNIASTSPVSLVIDDAPSISVNGPINACEGNGVFITPTPPIGSVISYQWQVDSIGGVWQNLTNTAGYSNTDTFAIGIGSSAVTSALDGNLYRIIIIANCGNDTSNAVVLNVTPRVSYTVQPINDTVCLGQTAVITATVLNANSFQWQSNAGGTYTNLSNNAIFSGVNSNTLSIANISPAQTGVFYRLRTLGNSPCGNVNSDVAQVFIAPEVNALTSNSSSFTFCPGLDTIMYFSFTGTVDSIAWQFDSGSGMLALPNNLYHSGVNNDTLLLTGMDATLDGNSYQAIIFNDCGGTDTSETIQVNIYEVSNYSYGSNQSVCLGEEAIFTQTTNYPVIEKQWQIWNGTTYVNLTNIAPYSGVNSDTLRINPTDLTMDNDSFRVSVLDSCGTLTLNVNAIVLNVLVPVINNESITLCNSDSLVLSDGQVVNVTGIYSDTIIGGASNFCDSIINYDLTILPQNFTSEFLALCSGDSAARADGSFVNVTGVYTDTLVNGDVNGCDSVHTINLTIIPFFNSNRTEVICFGDSFQLSDGSFVSLSGIYNDTIISSLPDGCDSVENINMTVLPLAIATRNETICFGDSMMLSDGTFVNAAGIYNDTLFAITPNGCDSVDLISLTIAPPIIASSNQTLCFGDGLVLSNGILVNVSGIYNDTLTDANGCDSVQVISLTIAPLISITSTVVLCFGDSLGLSNGSFVNISGTYNDLIAGGATDGCDSLNIIDLSILPLNNTNETLRLCFGDSLVLSDGSLVNSTGVFNDTLLAFNGCDSLHTYNLTVDPLILSNSMVMLCFGDSLGLSDGSFVNVSGIYNDTMMATNGCDSIDIIDLNILPLVSSNRTEIICFGDSLGLSDGSFTSVSGIYNDTLLAAANGCDSIDIIDLLISPLITTTRSETLCFGDSMILSDGSFINVSGTYNDTLLAITPNGCDSIDIINLTVSPFITNTVFVTICSNDSLVLSNGIVVNTTGIYNDTLSSADACDSLVIINLLVNPISLFIDNQNICSGEQYILPGGSVATLSGIYTDTLSAANSLGCDSIIETNLIILPIPNSLVIDSFCPGGSYTLASGTIVNLAGVFNDTLFASASNGCDSLVVYNLSLTAYPAAFQVVDTICFNETFVLPDGIVVNTTGIYTDTIPGSNSCDSIVVTNLFVRPVNSIFAQSNTSLFCTGEDALFYATSALQDVSYQWFNGGVPLLGATNDTLIFLNVNSGNNGSNLQLQIYALCDTIFSNLVALSIRQEASIVNDPDDLTICVGETASFSITTDIPVQAYQWYLNGAIILGANDDNYSTPVTTITDNANQYFCEITDSCGNIVSSVFATLNLNPNLIINVASSSVNSCATDDVTFFVQASGLNVVYQWLENGTAIPGENNDTLSLISVAGTQDGNAYSVQVSSDCGNIFSSVMNLTVNDVSQIISQTQDIIQCGGFSFNASVEANDIISYQWQINQGAGYVNLTDGTLGTGSIEIQGSATASLTVSNFDLTITGTQFQVLMTSFCGAAPIFIPLSVLITEPALIKNRIADTLFCLREISPIFVPYVNGVAEWSNGDLGQIFVPELTGDYIVDFTDINFCPQSDTIFVEIEDCVANCVVVAPSGFSPDASGLNDIFSAIYTCDLDFYELRVYNRWGELIFMSDDPLIGWDGTFKAENAQIGVYTWYLLYKKEGADRREDLKGNVTLLR
jgi:gliding motility-associated-like protein